jgi:hypothetical protein
MLNSCIFVIRMPDMKLTIKIQHNTVEYVSVDVLSKRGQYIFKHMLDKTCQV